MRSSMHEMEKLRALVAVALGLAATIGVWLLGLWAASGYHFALIRRPRSATLSARR